MTRKPPRKSALNDLLEQRKNLGTLALPDDVIGVRTDSAFEDVRPTEAWHPIADAQDFAFEDINALGFLAGQFPLSSDHVDLFRIGGGVEGVGAVEEDLVSFHRFVSVLRECKAEQGYGF